MSVPVSEEALGKKGTWEPIRHQFRYLPVHLALLRTGKVLAFAGSGHDETNPTPYPAEIWDPQTGAARIIDQKLPGDPFCAGHVFLPDGRLIVAGGTYKYDGKWKIFGFSLPPFRGLDHAYTFDPITETWTRVASMGTGRWYPTLVSLADGRTLAMAGLTKHFPWAFLRRIEVYSPGIGWSTLDGASRWLPLYPRLHLLPGGEVFYSGSFNTHYTFPFTIKGFPTAVLNVQTATWRTIGPPNQTQRQEGASILLPLTPPHYTPKVMLVGGGTPGGTESVSHTEVIDLSEAHPRWRSIQPMKHARYHVYPVILPDRRILIIGGRGGERIHRPPQAVTDRSPSLKAEIMQADAVPQDPRAVREAELFDVETETWASAASMKVDRLYHSNALLLPDGRVMAAGSNPGRRVNELRIEIYDPPYLFMGPRPVIEEIPSTMSYGTDVEIKTPTAPKIDEVALIRPSATTHGLDTEQRYVGLLIRSHSKGTITARVPDNRNVAPPGYYMLFILTTGIPSDARFVQLQ